MISTISFFYPKEGDTQVSENFKAWEFKSRNNSSIVVSTELIAKLQQLRNDLCAPININSGFRTQSHNTSVGGSKNSAHLIGAAVDIWTPKMSSMNFAEFIRMHFGKNVAIGAHPEDGYVHFDVVYRGNFYVTKLDNKVKNFK